MVFRELVVGATSEAGAAARMVRVMEGEFNRVLTTSAARLGRDASGEDIRSIGL